MNYSIKVAKGQDVMKSFALLTVNSKAFAYGESENGFIPSVGTDLVEKERQGFRLVFLFLAPPVGLEPTTCGLTVRRSTD